MHILLLLLYCICLHEVDFILCSYLYTASLRNIEKSFLRNKDNRCWLPTTCCLSNFCERNMFNLSLINKFIHWSAEYFSIIANRSFLYESQGRSERQTRFIIVELNRTQNHGFYNLCLFAEVKPVYCKMIHSRIILISTMEWNGPFWKWVTPLHKNMSSNSNGQHQINCWLYFWKYSVDSMNKFCFSSCK